MASTAQCLFCFEVLAASLEKRNHAPLIEIEHQWARYKAETGAIESHDESDEEENEDLEMIEDEDDDEEGDNRTDREPVVPSLQPKEVSRLQVPSPSGASTSSTPSTISTNSSEAAGDDASKSSSRSSLFSVNRKSQPPPKKKEDDFPLFVTWNTVNSRGHKSLRGCIGTFDAQELSSGLQSYALISAFDDTRFSPITTSELPSLSCSITLLMASTPCSNPMDWDLDTHGLRISFTHHGKRYSATYLPGIAVDQGWSKEETIVSLMRKAGWSGRSHDWKKVHDLRCVKYQGRKANADYRTWKAWQGWVKEGKMQR